MPRVISTHRPNLGTDELSAVARVFESGWLGQGDTTRAFEDALAERLGVPHVVAVSSGTAALHLALEALALAPGAGVLVPSLTFAATVQAILAARLQPIFCDVDSRTLQLDLDDLSRRATRRLSAHDALVARAVLPVHFGGEACDMRALRAIADENDLAIVEDAAHAFGSSMQGRPLGTLGRLGCFSFDPIKTITCGEGGAVATHDTALADRVRVARNLGIDSDGWRRHTGAAGWRYAVTAPGWRYHLPNVNAAIGLVQLARADAFIARRQALVRRYAEALTGIDGLVQVTRPAPDVCPFTYVVRVPGGRRDALMAYLRARGIGTSVEYIPNHLQPAFARWRVTLPATDAAFAEILSLPLHTALSDADVGDVIAAVQAFADQGGLACARHATC